MRLSSILTVLDKPKHPQTALEASIKLQQPSGAKIDLVAFRWDALLDASSMFDAKQRRHLRHQINTKCADWQAQLIEQTDIDADHTSARMIWSKNIADWLVDELKLNAKDLLVKSVHGKGSMLYTPMDWQLLRACSTPILFSRTKKNRPSKRILVALDFSHDDTKHNRLNNKVLQAACCFAELTGSELHCIFAIEISPVLRDLDLVDAKVSKRHFLEKSESFIERTLRAFDIPKSRRHFPIGKAGQLINAKAHQLNADLIVMGTSAHKFRQVIGLGNTAERILTKARTDVLAVHP